MRALFLEETNLPEEELDHIKHLLRGLTILLLVVSVAGIIVDGIINTSTGTILILSPIAFLLVISLILIEQNRFNFARFILPTVTYIAAFALIIRGRGLHDIVMLTAPMAILVASLALGPRGQAVFGVLTILGLAGVGVGELTGVISSTFSRDTEISDVLVVVIILGANALLQRTSSSQLIRNLERTKKSEQEQIKANDELRKLQGSLEDRVAERTLELEQRSRELADRTVQLELANIRTQKRATQLQAISDVLKAISSIHSISELLPRITELVSERFGYYHVGIFLTDATNRYAVLSASNSEGGNNMLARGHRLEVGTQGIVGYVTSTGNPRIALDVGEDAVFFNNPDLPETHSEMAIPLIVDKKIIGALDVQSTQGNAFTKEDTEVLSTLADQISIAIENARLWESSQKSMGEVEAISRQYQQGEWKRYTDREEIIGYKYGVTGVQPLASRVQSNIIDQALVSGEISTHIGTDALIAVPIKVRDLSIGALNVRIPGKKVWKSEEIAVVQAIAERVSISAENARLFEESQRRAIKEQTIGEISAKIGSSVNLEAVFRTAMQELNQLMPDTEIVVEFEDETKPSDS